MYALVLFCVFLNSYVHALFIKVLRETVKNLLQVTSDRDISSIAIPSLGTGKLGYPISVVAKILFSEILLFKSKHPSSLEKVVFVLNEDEKYEYFMKIYLQHLLECNRVEVCAYTHL